MPNIKRNFSTKDALKEILDNPIASDSSESLSDTSSKKSLRPQRKKKKVKKSDATSDDSTAFTEKVNLLVSSYKKRARCRKWPKKKIEEEFEKTTEQMIQDINKKLVKKLTKYKIPEKKLKRALEVMNSPAPIFESDQHPKIYNLVKTDRFTRPMMSCIRLMQEAQACIENRDFQNAAGIIHQIIGLEFTRNHTTNLSRLMLVALLNDPIARKGDYLADFLASFYSLPKNSHAEFLQDISQIPQSFKSDHHYNTTSRHVKSEMKRIEDNFLDTLKSKRQVEIKGEFKAASSQPRQLTADGEEPTTSSSPFRKFKKM